MVQKNDKLYVHGRTFGLHATTPIQLYSAVGIARRKLIIHNVKLAQLRNNKIKVKKIIAFLYINAYLKKLDCFFSIDI